MKSTVQAWRSDEGVIKQQVQGVTAGLVCSISRLSDSVRSKERSELHLTLRNMGTTFREMSVMASSERGVYLDVKPPRLVLLPGMSMDVTLGVFAEDLGPDTEVKLLCLDLNEEGRREVFTVWTSREMIPPVVNTTATLVLENKKKS